MLQELVNKYGFDEGVRRYYAVQDAETERHAAIASLEFDDVEKRRGR